MELHDVLRLASEAGFGVDEPIGMIWAEHREGICTDEVIGLVAAVERMAVNAAVRAVIAAQKD